MEILGIHVRLLEDHGPGAGAVDFLLDDRLPQNVAALPVCPQRVRRTDACEHRPVFTPVLPIGAAEQLAHVHPRHGAVGQADYLYQVTRVVYRHNPHRGPARQPRTVAAQQARVGYHVVTPVPGGIRAEISNLWEGDLVVSRASSLPYWDYGVWRHVGDREGAVKRVFLAIDMLVPKAVPLHRHVEVRHLCKASSVGLVARCSRVCVLVRLEKQLGGADSTIKEAPPGRA